MPAVAFGDSRVGKNPSGTVQGDPGKEFELGKASFFSWEGLEATSRETALRAPSVGSRWFSRLESWFFKTSGVATEKTARPFRL
jgi:hypothetical protein